MTRAKELVKLYKNLFKKMVTRYSFLNYLIGNEVKIYFYCNVLNNYCKFYCMSMMLVFDVYKYDQLVYTTYTIK